MIEAGQDLRDDPPAAAHAPGRHQQLVIDLVHVRSRAIAGRALAGAASPATMI
jgi:hypothetical protein